MIWHDSLVARIGGLIIQYIIYGPGGRERGPGQEVVRLLLHDIYLPR